MLCYFLLDGDSSLFKMQDSRSAGAIAGLAFAIVFTWRIFGSPSAPQMRHPKRQALTPGSSGVSSQFSENIPTSEVSPPSQDSNAQNVIDEFFQPVKVENIFIFPLPFYPYITNDFYLLLCSQLSGK